MFKRLILGIIGALVLLIAWWSFHHRASSDPPGSTGAAAGTSGRHSGFRGDGGDPVPVVAGKVEQKDTPIYLDGLGTVQAFNTVTVLPRSRAKTFSPPFAPPSFKISCRFCSGNVNTTEIGCICVMTTMPFWSAARTTLPISTSRTPVRPSIGDLM